MALNIDTHVRGIALYTTGDTKRSLIGRRLRSLIPFDMVLSSQGQIVVPKWAAHIVAQELSDLDVTWSDKAWEYVQEQREMLARMKAAKLEIQEAMANPTQALGDYPLSNKLDRYQKEAVAAICAPSLAGLALFDEQGLGKTIMTLCAYDCLRIRQAIDCLLVFAPKSVFSSWLNDIQKLFPGKYTTKVVSGTHLIRRKIIRSQYDILLCNYEVGVTELDVLQRTLKSRSAKVLLVVDESYFVKNPDAKRSKAISEIRPLCDRVVILCGTPAPNSPADLLNQINILDGGISYGNVSLPKDNNESAKIIRSLLSDVIYLRRIKEETLPDLPSKQLERLFLELSPLQRKLYDRARDDLILRVRSVDEQEFLRHLGSFMAQRMALLQICSHPASIDPLYTEEPVKLLALDQLVQELIVNQLTKIVIWSFFRYSLDMIAKRYSHYGLVRIDGSVSDARERIKAIRLFQEDPSIKIFLGNAAAAGAGITLTAAHHAIYESFSNQAAHYMQSIDRIHRRGQGKNVTYHILLANSTIEESEFDRLLQKEKTGRNLFGDIYKEPMTRERFLTDLGVTAKEIG